MPPLASNSEQAPADATPPRDLSAQAAEARPEVDPLRQLFHRHANHFAGARARQIHNRLRDRLFRDQPGDPETR
ncbi:MAG TPA: hypothetical protein VIK91_05745 [Nannocystis sp.]